MEQELELTDLSTQVTAVMLCELLKYEMLRLLPDFTLRDSHTSTFTDTNKQYGSQA
jgi:hypothetical protein